MRKQFIKSVKNILRADEKTVLMLGDIGVFGFREELKDLPERAYNIGILEQATVGVAAGLSVYCYSHHVAVITDLCICVAPVSGV